MTPTVKTYDNAPHAAIISGDLIYHFGPFETEAEAEKEAIKELKNLIP